MKLTPEKLTAFCAVLADTCNVGKACKAIDVSRYTAYKWRKDMPDFAEAWDEAMKAGVLGLEDEAHRRAFEGVEKPLTHLGNFTYLYREAKDEDGNAIIDEATGRPRMDPVLDERGNHKVAAVREYSDTLAIFLLKAHAPDKYRENTRMELTGANGGPVQISDTERAAKIAAILAAAKARKDGDVSDLI